MRAVFVGIRMRNPEPEYADTGFEWDNEKVAAFVERIRTIASIEREATDER